MPEPDPLEVRLLYSPETPQPKQHAFLLLDDLGVLEAFYGGAGGGGKSSTLLMAALRYVDVPGYAAILFRRTFADLNLPGALMDRGKTWLAGSDARWVERDFRFTFPSGATLSFGYLQTSMDRYRYASAEFQFIGFDELTHFDEPDYTFLFTRLRKPAALEGDARHPLSRVPLRMRSASNPGGRGHEWVKRRLVQRRPRPVPEGEPPDPYDTEERAKARVYIPARLEDNQHVDQDAYRESLANVDPVLREQILSGDWDIREPGEWVFDHDGIAAALELGKRADALLAEGRLTPPDGELLGIGLDWGEKSAGLIGWPLERGGLYVAHGKEVVGQEPGETANIVLGLLETVVTLGQQPRPKPPKGRRRPPALPPARHPLELVEDHRYDAAGVQSMRTYLKTVRKDHPRARSTSVAFGAPAPLSGAKTSPRSYKAETIGYLRRLLARTAAQVFHDGNLEAYVLSRIGPEPSDPEAATEHRGRLAREVRRLEGAGILAISARLDRPGPPHGGELPRELRAVKWANRDLGQVVKGDDHSVDALIALAAPLAIRHRAG